MFAPRKLRSRLGNPRPIVEGRLPEMWFSVSEIDTRLDILKILAGIDPLKVLKSNLSCSNCWRLPISSGSTPAKFRKIIISRSIWRTRIPISCLIKYYSIPVRLLTPRSSMLSIVKFSTCLVRGPSSLLSHIDKTWSDEMLNMVKGIEPVNLFFSMPNCFKL